MRAMVKPPADQAFTCDNDFVKSGLDFSGNNNFTFSGRGITDIIANAPNAGTLTVRNDDPGNIAIVVNGKSDRRCLILAGNSKIIGIPKGANVFLRSTKKMGASGTWSF